MSELIPCPFCKSDPVFPDAKDVFGTCYDAGCEDCNIPTISIQIIDCFDYPRDHVHDSWDSDTLQYGIEYIEVARQEAIKQWNTRHIPEGYVLVEINIAERVASTAIISSPYSRARQRARGLLLSIRAAQDKN